MRHGWKFRRLGRDTVHRRALLKNLATALIKHERIVTTLPKAKELRRVGDKVSFTCVSEIKNLYCRIEDDNVRKEEYCWFQSRGRVLDEGKSKTLLFSE